MSGLVKAKKYDWKDSNLALFGSDTEREVSLLQCSLSLTTANLLFVGEEGIGAD